MKILRCLLFPIFLAYGVSAGAMPTTWDSNGHEYEVVTLASVSWDAARAQAQALGDGWDLVTITSLAEQNFVTGLLPPGNGTLLEYYIGGLFSAGQWHWVSDEPFAFTYWGVNEPNGNALEPRLTLDARYRMPNWGWNDYTGGGAPFILGFVAEGPGVSAGVPEPASLFLFGGGLGATLLATMRPRRLKRELRQEGAAGEAVCRSL